MQLFFTLLRRRTSDRIRRVQSRERGATCFLESLETDDVFRERTQEQDRGRREVGDEETADYVCRTANGTQFTAAAGRKHIGFVRFVLARAESSWVGIIMVFRSKRHRDRTSTPAAHTRR